MKQKPEWLPPITFAAFAVGTSILMARRQEGFSGWSIVFALCLLLLGSIGLRWWLCGEEAHDGR
jgi:hypothetical protein